MLHQIKKLGDFCKTGSGGTPSRSQLDRYYEGGNIPWVKSGELREGLITSTEEHVTEAALRETSIKLVPAGAILLAMYGATVGRLAILGVEATTNQAVCHIVPDPDEADTRYLYHAISAQVPAIISMGVGGAQPNISQGLIKDLKVSLPPLPEQRRIAAILDQADALRTKRREALAQLDSLTQSIFIEMFGDPARNTRKLPCIPLGDLGRWQSGGTPPRTSDTYFLGSIPWFSSGELESMYVRESVEKITIEALNETSAKPVPRGALMLGMYDTAALKASIAGVDCSCNQAIAFASLDPTMVETVYVYHAICIGREHFRRLQRGVRQKNLNLEMIRQIKIPFPPLIEQKSYVERASRLNNIFETHHHSLVQLEALFSSLQHRAFRGEL